MHLAFENYLRISLLPALIQKECFLAQIRAFRIQTFAHHIHHDHMQNVIKLKLLVHPDQIHSAIIVHHATLMEHAAHVTLQLLIFMYLAIAEFSNRLCKCDTNLKNQNKKIIAIVPH